MDLSGGVSRSAGKRVTDRTDDLRSSSFKTVRERDVGGTVHDDTLAEYRT
jgi:hypothetical protein